MLDTTTHRHQASHLARFAAIAVSAALSVPVAILGSQGPQSSFAARKRFAELEQKVKEK